MKRYIGIALLVMSGLTSAAQIQRTVKQRNDSTAIEPADSKKKDSRKEMLKELDLTKEQKAKLREINQSMKASKEAIENDTTLSETERKEKLKTHRREHAAKVQAILTDEQKIKFRQLKLEKGSNAS